MIKKSFGFMLALVLVLSLHLPVLAETYEGDPDWSVTFTADEKMESNFGSDEMDEVIDGLQPGDNAIFTVKLTNRHKATTDWYMTNEVLSSLEDAVAVAKGGGYTYILTYTDVNGETRDLFRSDTVGGEDGEGNEYVNPNSESGLHEATDNLKDYFYLDTVKRGQSGLVTLEIGLDGETQGNDYQDTLADVQMNFAVELGEVDSSEPDEPSEPSEPDNPPPKTGDTTNILPYFIGMAVSGLLLLILAIFRFRGERKEKGGEA